MRVKRATIAYWPLAPLLLVAAWLVSTDLIGGSAYWRDHPVVANLVTDGILVLAVVFGLDRVLATRARRRWRPLASWW